MKEFITTQMNGFAGPTLEAYDLEHAIIQAEQLGMNVAGELVLTIENPVMTPKKADAIARALSESIDLEEDEDMR